MTERRYIPEIERKAIHYAWNYKCAYCRCDVPYNDLHIDHVIPVSLGGSCDLLNLVSSCSSCNLTKKDTRLIDMYEGLILSRARDKYNKVKKYLAGEVKVKTIKEQKSPTFFCLKSTFKYCGFSGDIFTYEASKKEIAFMRYVKDNMMHDEQSDTYTVSLPRDTTLDISTFSGSILEVEEYIKDSTSPRLVSISSPVTGIKTHKKEHIVHVDKNTFDSIYEVLVK
jgi:hypothetical protein